MDTGILHGSWSSKETYLLQKRHRCVDSLSIGGIQFIVVGMPSASYSSMKIQWHSLIWLMKSLLERRKLLLLIFQPRR
ncbi:hypothetical protein HYG81_22275 (plasmid) [Natrinema zhouii]|uniref:hypothetical protein n=1 Tax=Natrinema zhouii TaxID=1710539 RepID=UPI001CFF6131|nr:hypothetical protein [Natrinema zhouii]UHQ98817.1 hypothetical protein HYG81_22275 [Natrinema zhouii]